MTQPALLLRALLLRALLCALLLACLAPRAFAACPPAAQPLSDEQVRAGMRNAQDRGFLWRITRDGRSSYLYGTVHVSKQPWMFPGPRTMQALAASRVIALELDMLDPEIQRRLVQGMTATGPSPLPEGVRARLDKLMRVHCLDPARLAALVPEMQLITLTMQAARGEGLEAAYGADLFLAGMGRGAKKPVVSLETPEDQMRALLTNTPAETLEFVDSGLAELEKGNALQVMRRLTRAWAEGDFADLERYSQWCACQRTEAERAAMKRLLDDRNPALAARIDALHTQGGVFAAVGSLHLIGAAGLPALMAGRGYQVERVPFR